jgi:hypothetical protein
MALFRIFFDLVKKPTFLGQICINVMRKKSWTPHVVKLMDFLRGTKMCDKHPTVHQDFLHRIGIEMSLKFKYLQERRCK